MYGQNEFRCTIERCSREKSIDSKAFYTSCFLIFDLDPSKKQRDFVKRGKNDLPLTKPIKLRFIIMPEFEFINMIIH